MPDHAHLAAEFLATAGAQMREAAISYALMKAGVTPAEWESGTFSCWTSTLNQCACHGSGVRHGPPFIIGSKGSHTASVWLCECFTVHVVRRL